MTITEKIMAFNSGRDKVVSGELVWVDVHTVMTMDYLGKQTFTQLHNLGVTDVFDKNRVICVSDHLIPPPTEQFATMLNQWREVVKEHNITNFYDLGRQGIAHQIMVEQGHVLPGKISIGTDSHANIYGAVGAVGNAVGVTDAAVAMATGKAWFCVPESVKFNIIGEWQPFVMAKAFVGTCTNGRVEDFEIMAKILRGKKIHKDVNMICVPASQDVYLEAMEKGYLATLVRAGAAIDTPSCAACAGIHTGVAGDGDIVLSAGNRNMKGRMGSKNAQIYLTSPAVVAASAIRGEITDPREVGTY